MCEIFICLFLSAAHAHFSGHGQEFVGDEVLCHLPVFVETTIHATRNRVLGVLNTVTTSTLT